MSTGVDLASFLREGTKTAHNELEEKNILKSMRATHPDLKAWLLGYQTIAVGYQHMAGVICASGFCKNDSRIPDIVATADAYKRDIDALSAEGLAVLDEPPAPPALTSPSQTFGAVWCLNGSRYGARILLATAEREFGAQASRYLSGLRQQQTTPPKQKKRRNTAVPDPSPQDIEHAEALKGAQATFAYFTEIADAIWRVKQ
ncbi:MAG: hypothetical protein ABJ388_10950 [Alphaproteobacteria bacterium]|uniref:hypothetical protein n=1 Tax=Nisaea sp. TaxID=2024842 RepID=UPI0032654298